MGRGEDEVMQQMKLRNRGGMAIAIALMRTQAENVLKRTQTELSSTAAELSQANAKVAEITARDPIISKLTELEAELAAKTVQLDRTLGELVEVQAVVAKAPAATLPVLLLAQKDALI